MILGLFFSDRNGETEMKNFHLQKDMGTLITSGPKQVRTLVNYSILADITKLLLCDVCEGSTWSR